MLGTRSIIPSFIAKHCFWSKLWCPFDRCVALFSSCFNICTGIVSRNRKRGGSFSVFQIHGGVTSDVWCPWHYTQPVFWKDSANQTVQKPTEGSHVERPLLHLLPRALMLPPPCVHWYILLQFYIHSDTNFLSDRFHYRQAFLAALWGQVGLMENGTLRGEG